MPGVLAVKKIAFFWGDHQVVSCTSALNGMKKCRSPWSLGRPMIQTPRRLWTVLEDLIEIGVSASQ